MRVSMTVNGNPHTADVEPRTLLVDFLRDDLGLTGTKVGCDTSQCGTCIILVDGQSVKACTLLAIQADAADVLTIEGVATDARLSPLQDGFMEKHGLQCGFCTPGMILSLMDLLKRNPNPSEAEIRSGLEGNLCRCTGYQNVILAASHAIAALNSPVRLIADTPGKQFYERQVAYLLANDVDGLVENNYRPDAVLVTYDNIARGWEALKQGFGAYLKWVGLREVLSTDRFAEVDNSIFFEATVATNRGISKVFDVFILEEGKIAFHFTGVK